jgi:hypothetical protein
VLADHSARERSKNNCSCSTSTIANLGSGNAADDCADDLPFLRMRRGLTSLPDQRG